MLQIHSANDLLFVKRIKEATGSDKFCLALMNVVDKFMQSINSLLGEFG